MRFTQAASKFKIPKGTLYDNILGKSGRMAALQEVGLTQAEEERVLEFCCQVGSMPYNRRTNRSLKEVVAMVEGMRKKKGKAIRVGTKKQGFRWWWAFCKKYSIISLYFQDGKKRGELGEEEEEVELETEEEEPPMAPEDEEVAPKTEEELAPLAPPPAHAARPQVLQPPPAPQPAPLLHYDAHQQHMAAAAAAAAAAFFGGGAGWAPHPAPSTPLQHYFHPPPPSVDNFPENLSVKGRKFV